MHSCPAQLAYFRRICGLQQILRPSPAASDARSAFRTSLRKDDPLNRFPGFQPRWEPTWLCCWCLTFYAADATFSSKRQALEHMHMHTSSEVTSNHLQAAIAAIRASISNEQRANAIDCTASCRPQRGPGSVQRDLEGTAPTVIDTHAYRALLRTAMPAAQFFAPAFRDMVKHMTAIDCSTIAACEDVMLNTDIRGGQSTS